MTIVEVDVGLRLGQTLIQEFPTKFGADPLKIRTTRRFTRADRMAERALAFAKENRLANGCHVGRRLHCRKIKFLFDWRQ